MSIIDSAVRTNKGKKRQNNEDNFYFNGTFISIEEANAGTAHRKQLKDDFQIYAVCDGMGGNEDGELAAYLTVSSLNKINFSDKKNFSVMIKTFLNDINIKCREAAKQTRASCTIAMVCVIKKYIVIINAGDSRIYLWRKNKLSCISEEHTYARFLYSKAMIDENSIESHPQKNMLLQYIGMPENYEFQPYISKPLKMRKEDVFLICSDGLTDMVDDIEISRILAGQYPPSDICKSLVSSALSNGGLDNVTVMAVKCIKV